MFVSYIVLFESMKIDILSDMKRRFRRTTIISVGLIAFLAGLALAKIYGWQSDLALSISVCMWFLVFRKRTFKTLAIAVIAGLLFGIWRGGLIYDKVLRYDATVGKDVTVRGVVLDDPVYDEQGRTDFRVGKLVIDGSSHIGQIRVKAHINGISRGDFIEAQGKLSSGFGNYQASMYFASVKITDRSASPIETLRRKFFAAVYSALPEPQASLGLGFLVGLRSALPEDLDNQLRVAGLTHIVVASGYNLTVLVRLCRRLLAKYSKYQAFAGSVTLIIGFVMVTGASPSMVRASVVTVLSLLAWYYGRKFQPLVIILLGAAITAGLNPLYIWYDLGWWLSFLAFAGVLIIAPLLSAVLWKGGQPPLIAQVAIETSSAQIMATPLILLVFGEVSLVALFANIAVVPLIPLAMAGTFVAGITGFLLPGTWGAIVGVPANLILSYIVSVTRFFAAPHWAQQSVSISSIGMLFFYSGTAFFAFVIYRKSRLKFSQLPSVVE